MHTQLCTGACCCTRASVSRSLAASSPRHACAAETRNNRQRAATLPVLPQFAVQKHTETCGTIPRRCCCTWSACQVSGHMQQAGSIATVSPSLHHSSIRPLRSCWDVGDCREVPNRASVIMDIFCFMCLQCALLRSQENPLAAADTPATNTPCKAAIPLSTPQLVRTQQLIRRLLCLLLIRCFHSASSRSSASVVRACRSACAELSSSACVKWAAQCGACCAHLATYVF